MTNKLNIFNNLSCMRQLRHTDASGFWFVGREQADINQKFR